VADHVLQLAEAKLGHDLPELFSNEEEEVDDVLGLAGELLAEFRILSRDTNRAGVEMALAHHDAAHRDERCGGEAELFGPQ
jgi:hypothetical protein